MSDIYVVEVDRRDPAASVARTRALVEQTGAPAIGFMATAVPNGENLEDRLKDWVARFRVLKKGLEGVPARVGILVQALIGHGDRRQLVREVPFQKIVGHDGAECRECCCPLDKDFQDYARKLITGLAQAAPTFFMVDDDFRIAYHAPAHKGCMCRLHLERFAATTGVPYTRESLISALRAEVAVREQWEKLREQSLVEMASVIRGAIDSVDASIRGAYCTVIGEAHFAPAIAATLAGRHPLLARIHNACYLENGHKGFPLLLTRTRHEIARFPPGTTILTEADTCPHSRYSLSLKTHLAHLVATTLLGCHGAKYWFIKADEEGAKDTAPFAAMLASVRPYLEEVGRMRDDVLWQGPRVAARMEEVFRKPWDSQDPLESPSDGWGSQVLGRMGIAFSVTDTPEGSDGSPCLLSGSAPHGFSDAELRRFLSGPLLLDGEAAWHLAQKGLSPELGVHVGEAGFCCSGELIQVGRTGETTETGAMGGGSYLLEPLSPATKTLSRYFLGTLPGAAAGPPGLTWYENELGGRVAVYGLSLRSPVDWVLFNRKRKRQLLETLEWLGASPVVVETDLDVCLLHGASRSRGLRYLAAFDLSPDTIEGFSFQLPEGRPTRIERLAPDGRWERVGFSREGDRVRCAADATTMEPLILRLYAGSILAEVP